MVPQKPLVDVRYATVADLAAMADLLGELFTLETDFAPDRERQLAGLRLILETPSSGRLFVLCVDGQVAGMATALCSVSTALGAPVLLLEDVIVGGPYRGAGYGRRLVQHVCAWAKAQGMARVTLLADRDNQAALAFYDALGFGGSAMLVRRLLL